MNRQLNKHGKRQLFVSIEKIIYELKPKKKNHFVQDL